MPIRLMQTPTTYRVAAHVLFTAALSQKETLPAPDPIGPRWRKDEEMAAAVSGHLGEEAVYGWAYKGGK